MTFQRDMTFMTSSNVPVSGAIVSSVKNQFGVHGLESKSHHVVADNVMQHVAGELGLVTSAEVLKLRDMAHVQTSALDFLLCQLAQKDDDTDMQSYNKFNETIKGSPQSVLHQNEVLDHEQVPHRLFKRPMGENYELVSQSVPLNSALKALHQTVSQPLTNYEQTPAVRDYFKPTQSSVVRENACKAMTGARIELNNRIERCAKDILSPNQGCSAGKVRSSRNRSFNIDCNKFSTSLQKRTDFKTEANCSREQTLEQMDFVLQRLNSNSTGWSEKQIFQAIKNASHNGHATKCEKETMREMREFAHPYAGVKSLLRMVHHVEAEFQS
eukprot:CAMPEP_0170354278 /NCGR_PEP_ID=MMETSP0117_2-20130122/17_1 /TAXON_ID=400756 /ORGANISM="Durinskia baltica, Strain CSIRO CS-38" /LENGTH=326 /DNA_ID=CAMNT_0010608225 /DNA_START=443 /DNA_END=1423 /DNA_ORIENTATION=-